MKKYRRLGILCFFSFLLLAHGMTGPAMAKEKKSLISIGTHPIGSFFNSIGTAVAKVVGDNCPMRTTVKPMKGPVAWYPYMQRKAVDLGVLNMWDAEKGWLGESIYDKISQGKGFPVRLIAVSVYNSTGFWVAKNSGIEKISDIKGKRVCGKYPTPSLHFQAECYLANGGLTWDDVVLVPVNSIAEGIRMVIEGRADASAGALGMSVVEELNAKKGARILPIDNSAQAVSRTRKSFPGYPVKETPGPGKTGVEKEQYLWAYDTYLICRESMPEEEVYKIVEALWNHHEDLGKIHKRLKAWTPDKFVSAQASVPYHPGAVRFYKEKGAWTPEMETLQSSLLKKKP